MVYNRKKLFMNISIRPNTEYSASFGRNYSAEYSANLAEYRISPFSRNFAKKNNDVSLFSRNFLPNLLGFFSTIKLYMIWVSNYNSDWFFIAIQCLHLILNFTNFREARTSGKIMVKTSQFLGSYSAEYSVKTAEYSVFGRNQFFLFRSYTSY